VKELAGDVVGLERALALERAERAQQVMGLAGKVYYAEARAAKRSAGAKRGVFGPASQ
jgi:hypothetical protein